MNEAEKYEEKTFEGIKHINEYEKYKVIQDKNHVSDFDKLLIETKKTEKNNCPFYKIRKYAILISVNGYRRCPQFVHISEILIVQITSSPCGSGKKYKQCCGK